MPTIQYPRTGLNIDLDQDNGLVKITPFDQASADAAKEHGDPVTFNAEDIHPDLIPRVGLFGLSSLLQTRTSSLSTEGADARIEGMKEVFRQISVHGDGKWEKTRVVGSPVVSAEVEALADLRGVSIPDIQESLKRYSKDDRAKILANDAVKVKADELRKARATKSDEASPDLSDLL